MRVRNPLPAAALLLAVLAIGAVPAFAQDSGSGGGQGGSSGGSGGGSGSGGDAGQGGQGSTGGGSSTGDGGSGSSGTTGDLNAPQGQRSTSDVEDPGSGTTGALPGDAAVPAGPMVALPEDRVRRVQERLAAAGFDPGPADGTMGARTRAALRAFQEERGLDPTGEPNEATLTELGVE